MRRTLPGGLILFVAVVACEGSPRDVIIPAPKLSWVYVEPTQCGGSPWERAGLSLDEYLVELEVEVHDVTTERFAEAVCLSCACPTGERVCVLVDLPDVPPMRDEGFLRDSRGVCPAP